MTRAWRYARGIFVSRDNLKIHSCPPVRSCFRLQPSSRSPPFSNTNRRTMSSSSLRVPHALRSFPSSGFELIDHSEKIEEETLPTYHAEKYYPVHIGEVLNNQYQVLAKLGYGVTSTVWLCRDLSESKYVVLKVNVSGVERNHEISVYDRINLVETNHLGKSFIRKLLGHFHIEGPHGRHICLVHQPFGPSLDQFLSFFPERVLSLEDLKPCLRQILGILDFLHTDAHIIHTIEISVPKNSHCF